MTLLTNAQAHSTQSPIPTTCTTNTSTDYGRSIASRTRDSDWRTMLRNNSVVAVRLYYVSCADDTRIVLYRQCGQLTLNYWAVHVSHNRLERVCHPPYNATLVSPTPSSSVLRSRARRDAFGDSTCRVMLSRGICEHIIHVVELVQARLDHKGSVHFLCKAKQGLTAHQSILSRLMKVSSLADAMPTREHSPRATIGQCE